MDINKIIFGKNPMERIVSIEAHDGYLEIFRELEDGTIEVTTEIIPNAKKEEQNLCKYWILSDRFHDRYWHKLKGDLHYKYYKLYMSREEFTRDRYQLKKEKADTYSIWNPVESAMVIKGLTYFKGMKTNEVSVLSFDIETTGLDPNAPDARVIMIANTYRDNKGNIKRRLFSYDQFDSDKEMFEAWVWWVNKMDPSIIVNHNIFSFDLPYLTRIAAKNGVLLRIGRDGSPVQFEDWDSTFRFDGAIQYKYRRCHIYGREIVDTWFLAMKYDIGRNYTNYKLKNIIAEEGLEDKDRQHYDASKIRDTYKDPVELEKIKNYARFDGDDALKLYDLFIPPFFYMNNSIPKPFQMVCYTASGSQINSMIVRAYMQQTHSIPKASDNAEYEGAITFGNPGIYKDVHKIDVASLYPNIMISYKVWNNNKDPLGVFGKMINYFTEERLENKSRAGKTGDRYYNDLQAAQKIIINSFYGFMGAKGLNFNSPSHAAEVTRRGREIIEKSINWANKKGLILVNGDTDSISYTLNRYIPKNERESLINDVNKLYDGTTIRFEDDGYYKDVLVLKKKNYYLINENGKVTIKGSGLKATKKPPVLKNLIVKILNLLLKQDFEEIVSEYKKMIIAAHNVKDISQWAAKYTITEKVFTSDRTNEIKLKNAIQDSEYTKGDKVYCYFDIEDKLKLVENWNKDHHIGRLMSNIYDTLKMFSGLIPNFEKRFIKYTLKKSQEDLKKLIEEDNEQKNIEF